MNTLVISVEDRIVLRDRPWVAREVAEVEGHRRLLKLEALDDDQPASFEVAVPPEEPHLLPAEAPAFDLAQLDSLAAWASAHRILAATLVQNTGLISGGPLRTGHAGSLPAGSGASNPWQATSVSSHTSTPSARAAAAKPVAVA